MELNIRKCPTLPEPLQFLIYLNKPVKTRPLFETRLMGVTMRIWAYEPMQPIKPLDLQSPLQAK